MKAKLKRCPFCNSHNLTMDRTSHTGSVRCVECGAMGPISAMDRRAVRYWNGQARSTNPSALVANRKSNHHDLKTIEL